MGEKMSLQQVRDAMLEEKAWARGTGWPMAAGMLQRWANAIDAHLTQPAQAVDVGAIRKVAKELSMDFVASEKQLRRWADKLTAALPNANEAMRNPNKPCACCGCAPNGDIIEERRGGTVAADAQTRMQFEDEAG